VKSAISAALLLGLILGFITSGYGVAVRGDAEWTLQIDGAVSNSRSITLDELMAMPKTVVPAALYCFGSLVTSGNWTGVRLRIVLETVGFDQNATRLEFLAADGYTSELSITEAFHENVIIAYELDGVPLSETLRLVLPGENGSLWIAQITNITISMANPSLSQPNNSTGNETPAPQQSPSPSPSPSSSTETQAPSSSSTSTAPTDDTNEQKPTNTSVPQIPVPFSVLLIVASVATLSFAGAGLFFYFRKRKL
jgi:DMSO/TMAO reductase YedYZ molybdopterin-dependent catalytic subunit